MALLKGKLLVGALFAGALFNAAQAVEAAVDAKIHTGSADANGLSRYESHEDDIERERIESEIILGGYKALIASREASKESIHVKHETNVITHAEIKSEKVAVKLSVSNLSLIEQEKLDAQDQLNKRNELALLMILSEL